MNRYEELAAFVGVVEHGSFSAAAERLGSAKSAVSRRVSELEARLGVRLLNRTTRRLSLTDAGHALHERAVRILADWEEAEQTVSADSTQLSGRLKIAAPLSFGIRYLGPVVAEFAKAHPDVQMEVDLGDREVDLVDEGFDLAIRIGELADSTLVARRLNTIDMICVASKEYLDTHGRPESPENLSRHKGLRYTLAKRGAIWRLRDSNGRLHQARPRTALAANNGDHIMQACEAGLGIAVLPLFIAHNGIRKGILEPVLTDYRLDAIGMYLVYPPGRYSSRRVQVFSGHMADHFHEQAPWDDCPGVDAAS
ncbi:MAG: LysR family transcriptional regulator [Pseudomonadota bacterium]|nr:LysR family transcriptional regulator [Pseudomonadota bacterium]